MTKHVDEPGHQHTAPDHDSRAAGPIPVLRLDTARRADGTFDETFLAGLRTALHGIGFLQLTGYGATPGQIGELTAAAARFFALPLEQRLRLDNRLSPHFRGYTRLGHEITAGRADAREQIDFAPEQAPVPRELWDAPYRLLEGPNQWPDDTVPELRPLVEQWAGLLSAVGLELTRAIAMALALPEDHFDQYFAHNPHWFGKLIHYVGAADGTDLQGVGPHTDWNFLTLLLQDDTGGLQALPAGTDQLDRRSAGRRRPHREHRRDARGGHPWLSRGHPPPGPALRARTDPRLDRLFLGPPAGRVPRRSAIAARIRRAGPRSQPSPRITSCTAASATTHSRAGCARTPRSQRPTTPTCSLRRTRLTDHHDAVEKCVNRLICAVAAAWAIIGWGTQIWSVWRRHEASAGAGAWSVSRNSGGGSAA